MNARLSSDLGEIILDLRIGAIDDQTAQSLFRDLTETAEVAAMAQAYRQQRVQEQLNGD